MAIEREECKVLREEKCQEFEENEKCRKHDKDIKYIENEAAERLKKQKSRTERTFAKDSFRE